MKEILITVLVTAPVCLALGAYLHARFFAPIHDRLMAIEQAVRGNKTTAAV
jgi:hypothetical protein